MQSFYILFLHSSLYFVFILFSRLILCSLATCWMFSFFTLFGARRLFYRLLLLACLSNLLHKIYQLFEYSIKVSFISTLTLRNIICDINSLKQVLLIKPDIIPLNKDVLSIRVETKDDISNLT